MRITALILAAGVLLAGTGLRVDAGESSLVAANRKLREQELTITLLERRVQAQKRLNVSLLELFQKEFETLQAARDEATTGVAVLRRQIKNLKAALEAERASKGVDRQQTLKDLAAEQDRHTRDVLGLQQEIASANQYWESCRKDLFESRLSADRAKDEKYRAHDHIARCVSLLGEMGPAATFALPWLKETENLHDEILAEVAKAAAALIEADGR